MDFALGERVVVITHDPDPDYRNSEIPIGTEGVYVESCGGAPNPITDEPEDTGWVRFELPHENHPWTRKDGSGLIACMFHSMLSPVDDTFFDVDLDDLFD